MIKSFQSVSYQYTDQEGDSVRDIIDIRAFLLLLFSCIYFKFCSCFMFNFFIRRVGAGFSDGLPFFVFVPTKSKKFPCSSCIVSTVVLLSRVAVAFCYLKNLSFFLFQKYLIDLFFQRPPCHPQSTVKSLLCFFHSQFKYVINPFEYPVYLILKKISFSS